MPKKRNIKIIKVFAYFSALGTALVFVIANYSNIKELFFDVFPNKAVFRRIAMDTAKVAKVNPNLLFDRPYYFHLDNQNSNAVDGLTFTNNDISINIDIAQKTCFGFSYYWEFEKFNNIEVIKVIPYEFTNGYRPAKSIFDKRTDKVAKQNIYSTSCYVKPFDELDDIYRFDVPTFNIKINNNSKDHFVISSITARVHKSATNKFPLISFGEGFGFDLPIFNFGNGIATDVSIKFNIQSREEPINFLGNYKYTLNLPDIKPCNDYRYFIANIKDLTTFFKQEGVDIKYLKENPMELELNQKSKNEYYMPCSKSMAKKIFGRFIEGAARVVGEVYYSGILPTGKMKKDTVRFNYIQSMIPPSIGGTSGSVNSIDYNFRLRANGDEYQETRNEAKEVSSNSFKTLKMKFFSGQYAYHLFDLEINILGKEKFVIPNIFLDEFLPFPEGRNLQVQKRKRT
jgi:hypothetical protein